MSEMTRRDMGWAAAAFAMLGGLMAEAQTAGRTGEHPPGTELPPGDMTTPRVFRFSQMTVRAGANGGWGRAVVHGTLPTGEFVEVHQTMLPPGKMPHPPHKHSNTEFILLREGEVTYLTDGRKEIVKPGDVIYTASNQPHGMVNEGAVPAMYYVVSVGVQPGSTPVTLRPPV